MSAGEHGPLLWEPGMAKQSGEATPGSRLSKPCPLGGGTWPTRPGSL